MLGLLKLVGALLALYLAIVGAMAIFQGKLLFPRGMVGPGLPLPPTAERLTLPREDGVRLVGVHLPAEARPAGEPPAEGASLILGFGGNAWNADSLALHLRAVFPDRDIVTFHYRGYSPSTGTPTAWALLEDAVAIHDDIVTRLAPARIVAVGVSLGTGPAAHLARSRPIAGAILVTPFDSLTNLARDLYPWLPVDLLLRHRMDVAADLAATTAPVAVIAAAADRVVPPRRTEPVRQAATTLILDRTIDGASHNDLYDRAAYRRAMADAVSLIDAR